jgi:putative iron-regulated protein
MPRTPFTVSLLSLALLLSGCGDEPAASSKTAAITSPAATSQSVTPGPAPAQAAAVVNQYANLAFAVFSDALISGEALQEAVNQLLAQPTEANLQLAREAWLIARKPYLQSEVFRFGNPVVDDWEGQLNAWPLDEGLIDYVATDYQFALGNPGAQANIIANQQLPIGEEQIDLTVITPDLLASLNELGGSEANVATGYHAIEFLLWGQDLHGSNPGAGERPASDFALDAGCTGGHCERRREYLKAATALLVTDLQFMVGQWQADQPDNYRAQLQAEPADSGLRKMLFGMGSLSLGELAGERMKVALEANSTEDEQDCFSDNTHNSHFYDAKGVRNVYLGEYQKLDGSTLSGPSLSSLLAAVDAPADQQLQAELAATEASLQKIVDSAEQNNQHFDQLIAADNQAGQQLIRDAIAALVTQTASIEKAAGKLGISELQPDSADHQF